MQPSLPLPTDNIYKFSCLFSLVLIVSSLFSFVASYGSALEQKIKYSEVVISLEEKAQRTRGEDELLAMNKRLIEVTRANELTANYVIFAAFIAGLGLSDYGAWKWHQHIQPRDDQLTELQLRKLSAELAKLEKDAPRTSRLPPCS